MSDSDDRSFSQRKSRRLAGLCPDIPTKRCRLRNGPRSTVPSRSTSASQCSRVRPQRSRTRVRRHTAVQSCSVSDGSLTSCEQISASSSQSLHEQPSTSSACNSTSHVQSSEEDLEPLPPGARDYDATVAAEIDYSLPSSSSDEEEESGQELATTSSLWSVSMTNYRTTLQQSIGQHSSGTCSGPRSVPGSVQGESFCKCPQHMDSRDLLCSCGEEEADYLEWTWDVKNKSAASEVFLDGKEIRFHTNYSSGTAVARGNMPLVDRQYFWEIKMMTPVYGTDMMVGVGTDNVDLNSNRYNFCSILGRDQESWGWSYSGKTQHGGKFRELLSARFGQGSIVGLHLDTWLGRLTIYKNRQPIGVVFTGLRGKILYPMISSTAARTGMRLVTACSYKTSLGFRSCMTLRQFVPKYLDVTCAISMPPGLINFLSNNLSWLLRAHEMRAKPSQENTKNSDKGKKKMLGNPSGEQGSNKKLKSDPAKEGLTNVRDLDTSFEECDAINVMVVNGCIQDAGSSYDHSSAAISRRVSGSGSEVHAGTAHDDSGASCSYNEYSSVLSAQRNSCHSESSNVGCTYTQDTADVTGNVDSVISSSDDETDDKLVLKDIRSNDTILLNLDRRDDSCMSNCSVYNVSDATVSVCNDVCRTHALELPDLNESDLPVHVESAVPQCASDGSRGAIADSSRHADDIPRHSDTDILRHVDSEVTSKVDTAVPAHVGTNISGHVESDLLATVDTVMPINVDTDIPTPVNTDMPSHVTTDMSRHVNTDMPRHFNTDMPRHVNTDMPSLVTTDMFRHVNTDMPSHVTTDMSRLVNTDMSSHVDSLTPEEVDGCYPATSGQTSSEAPQTSETCFTDH